MKVHEAITEVMRAVPAVKKEDRNNQQNFNFRGIDAVLNAVGPKLRDHGVIVVPELQEHHAKEITTKGGTKMNSVFVVVRYTFFGPEGDSIAAEVPGEAADAGDKAFSKAMSVAFRTALLQTLALPTDEKDPDESTYERSGPATGGYVDKAALEVKVAEEELLAKVRRMQHDPADVAQLYYVDYGHTIKEETDAANLRDFADRLQPKKKEEVK